MPALPARTRRLAVAAAAAASGLALALLPSAPASALTIPDWPASRIPVGCSPTNVVASGASLTSTYNDTLVPTVTGWTYGGATKRKVLRPGSNNTTFAIAARQGCSGVAGIIAAIRVSSDGSPASFVPIGDLSQITGTAFAGTWGIPGTNNNPTTTGWIEVPVVGTAPRYSAFQLDESFALINKTAWADGPRYVTGPWSLQRVYLVLDTKLSGVASKTTVAKGGTVKLTAALKRTDGAAYAAYSGAKLKLQTKLPGKAWTTRATVTTSSTGKASYTLKPGASLAWRFVLAENITVTPYTAAAATTAKKITVS